MSGGPPLNHPSRREWGATSLQFFFEIRKFSSLKKLCLGVRHARPKALEGGSPWDSGSTCPWSRGPNWGEGAGTAVRDVKIWSVIKNKFLACPDSITHQPKIKNTVPHAEGGYPGTQGKREANDCIALCAAPGLGLSGPWVKLGTIRRGTDS